MGLLVSLQRLPPGNRRAGGGFRGWYDSAVCFIGSAPSIYRSSPHAERLFCDVCGTPLGYRDDRLPGETYFYTGVLDDPTPYAPDRQAFVDERLPWTPLNPHLPQHARSSRLREDGSRR